MPQHAVMAESGFAFETLTIATTALAFTAATRSPSDAPGAVAAFCGPLEAGQVRYRLDGTAPTASVGHLLEVGDTLLVEGPENVRAIQFIRVGGVSGTLPVTFLR